MWAVLQYIFSVQVFSAFGPNSETTEGTYGFSGFWEQICSIINKFSKLTPSRPSQPLCQHISHVNRRILIILNIICFPRFQTNVVWTENGLRPDPHSDWLNCDRSPLSRTELNSSSLRFLTQVWKLTYSGLFLFSCNQCCNFCRETSKQIKHQSSTCLELPGRAFICKVRI